MKISIIVPVFKVELYIEKCIKSILQQTYTGDLECLIIDDATPDNSISIVEQMLSEKKNNNIEFKIIHHKQNKGLSAARNTGIHNATGDYIYFLDSDDFLESNCILELTRMLHKYPDVELIQAGAISKNQVLSLKDKTDLPEYTQNKEWIKQTLLRRDILPVTSWNKLIKKDFIIKNNLYFKEGIIHEDEHWNYFACKFLSSIAICKKDTYNYITREGSIMHSHNIKSIESWLLILNDFIENIDSFCRHEQIVLIFDRLHPMYVFYPRKIKSTSTNLLKKLSYECTIIGKITIWSILHFPFFINKNKFIYNKLINKFLLPLF